MFANDWRPLFQKHGFDSSTMPLVFYITMMTLCFCSLRWKQKELESFLTELALRLDEEDIRQLQRNVSLALAIYATQIIVVAVVYFFRHVSTDSGLIEVFHTAYYGACVSTFHWVTATTLFYWIVMQLLFTYLKKQMMWLTHSSSQKKFDYESGRASAAPAGHGGTDSQTADTSRRGMAGTGGRKDVNVVVLGRDNNARWRIEVETALRGQGLYWHASGAEPRIDEPAALAAAATNDQKTAHAAAVKSLGTVRYGTKKIRKPGRSSCKRWTTSRSATWQTVRPQRRFWT